MNDRPARAFDRVEHRREAFELSAGTATFVDDIPIEGDWFGGTVRSRIAHGRLVGLQFDSGFDWSRVVVVTAAEIPGTNEVVCHEHDQPSLCDGVIRHVHEPIALIAAPNADLLADALKALVPIEEPIAAVFDVEEALTGTVKIFGNDNVFLEIPIRKGDPESVLSMSSIVVETEHRTPAQEHAYLENQGIRAIWADHGVVIQGSLQCPYYLVVGVAKLLGIDPGQVRVIAQQTGGAFGGKEDFPTMLAGHAALLSRRCGHPVRMIYSRTEDMKSTTKRHPAVIRHRTGLSREGRIEAVEVDVIIDGGAYATLSPFVISRAALHAVGPYRCENVRVNAKAVATNHPPNGAFRGFGCPQVHFATETHLEVCADRLGLDPIEFRRINLLRPGDTMPFGQTLNDDASISDVFETALAETNFTVRREEILEYNRSRPAAVDSAKYERRGIGVSVYMHGSGLNEYWEGVSKSRVRLSGTTEGKVEVLTAQVEFGQGTLTSLGLIAAEAMGMETDDIVVSQPDTDRVPDSGPTVASRTVAIVGSLICRAAVQLREKVAKKCGRESIADVASIKKAISAICENGELIAEAQYSTPDDLDARNSWAPHDAYSSYSWACCIVEVSVDMLTGETSVTKVDQFADVGKVVSPILAAGQIRGGTAQGIGWALTERVSWDESGGMRNGFLSDYAIPSASDLPDIGVRFLDVHGDGDRRSVKGIGELAMEGPAPAIANAIAMAIGRRPIRLPIGSEELLSMVDPKLT